ncbi:histidine triad nucleotide-binding protein [Patescibacteria group bacterium]
MGEKNCIFCKIANGDIPKQYHHEDKLIVAFDDAHPLAPVHVLIIPRKHILSIDDLKEGDVELAGRMVLVAQKIARKLNIANDGYKLLFRVKKHGGQEVDHIHLHLVGGAPLSEDIRPLTTIKS